MLYLPSLFTLLSFGCNSQYTSHPNGGEVITSATNETDQSEQEQNIDESSEIDNDEYIDDTGYLEETEPVDPESCPEGGVWPDQFGQYGHP